MNTPHIIQFPKIGKTIESYIPIAENDTLPFEVKRVCWTYFTPESITRGSHAHYDLEQISEWRVAEKIGTIPTFCINYAV